MKKVIIVTGGANGLGLELVKQGLDRGLFVCNIDKDKIYLSTNVSTAEGLLLDGHLYD